MNGSVTYEGLILQGGDPSPTNIRPISGWSSCEVTVTDDLTNPTYTNTYTIPFKDSSDNPINAYRGTIDISTGVVTLDTDSDNLNTISNKLKGVK